MIVERVKAGYLQKGLIWHFQDKLDRNIIKQYVQFVCIDLLDGEDEQQVFDTINSLGVRLTTAELLKNYFYNKDNVQEYETNWFAIFEKDSETRLYWEQFNDKDCFEFSY